MTFTGSGTCALDVAAVQLGRERRRCLRSATSALHEVPIRDFGLDGPAPESARRAVQHVRNAHASCSLLQQNSWPLVACVVDGQRDDFMVICASTAVGPATPEATFVPYIYK